MVKNLIFCGLFSISCTAYAAPSLMLAEEYRNQHVENWAASEKLDGVRAYWDGKKLLSRQGYAFTPPPGFTKNFPDYPLDGELYAGRGRFEQTSAAVRSASGDWSGIRLHVFDVPQAQGNLYKRLAVIEDRLKKYPANISVVRQMPVKDIAQARAMMEKIVAGGGEGVILRDPAVPYAAGRSSSYLKLKPQQDAECTVTKHYEGKERANTRANSALSAAATIWANSKSAADSRMPTAPIRRLSVRLSLTAIAVSHKKACPVSPRLCASAKIERRPSETALPTEAV